ncbi:MULTISPECIES: LysR family transcriptional regulator [Micromonospora]|uniref:LysR family transcriptional regulator n=1 Tax=Micromonospora solifontis TaxID=2487138 RepID=A0ABX9WK83_9ACTN|nr:MULTISPECIES: LysR family transcriptional regulator [Micromonospora]NES13122.1 LysR family transcriptional regulator [Micromonospora sp. PPF5-17B]NES36313.1 LysR family transcriptional regulator [Micromonospora solifontis]NES55047.1 LysR family transcriptional regulator [Micromonospora sp. PPF5-6]RNL99715.1 LysR family transcriptional regulator [Micromonospora solifontis]
MELRHLQYFTAVVRCGGFTRAAEQLRIAQPAVSAQIRQLERELGVTLLARTTRRVALTPAGEAFLSRAERILAEVAAARDEAAELAGALRGRVALGATPVLGPLALPETLSRFHQRHPGISVTLRSGLVAALLAELDQGRLDLVVGPLHTDLPARYRTQPLSEEELLLATPPGHRLAPRAAVSLAALRDEPFVCLPAGSGLRTLLDQACAAAGFTPRVQFETHSPASIRELVSCGLGVALLARSATRVAGPPIATVTTRQPLRHPPIGLIHLGDRRLTQAAEALRRQLAATSPGAPPSDAAGTDAPPSRRAEVPADGRGAAAPR